MRTLTEIAGLIRSAGSVWWRFALRMTFWYLAGFVLHQLGNYLSVLLGSAHQVAATLSFVIGLVAMVAATVLIIQCCTPAIGGPEEMASVAATDTRPTAGQLEVLSMTIGPFLAAYALWGLVEDEVSSLFVINVALTGLGGYEQWSINLQWTRFYISLAVIAWLLRQLLAAVNRRVSSTWLLVPTVITEGLWVVASLVAAFGLFHRGLRWFEGRAAWHWMLEVWYWFVGWLPDLSLPFDLTLPQALTRFGGWFWHTLLPGLADGVLLPLVWLALTATVFGWRELTAGDVLAGTPLEAPAGRVRTRWSARTTTPVGRLLIGTGAFLTADLRTKFVPVAHACRLVLRAGPAFVGAYLVVAALAQAVPEFGYAALDYLIGPQSQAEYLARMAATDLVIGWLGITFAVAVYVAAFARVRAVSGGTAGSAPATLARSAD
jgi:hypothetical protein